MKLVHQISHKVHLFNETKVMKKESQVKLTSFISVRCFVVTFTKYHNLTLRKLIGKLHLEVAALVDSNYGSEKTQTRRGRRKYIDSKHILLGSF